MKIQLNDSEYSKVVEKLREWVTSLESQGKADFPLLITSTGKSTSPRDILKEVENQTDYGKNFVSIWIGLSMDHILDSLV